MASLALQFLQFVSSLGNELGMKLQMFQQDHYLEIQQAMYFLDCLIFPFSNYHHSKIKSINISDIWYNRYLKDHICRPHIHTGCSYSAIYLLHLQEPNPTVFIPNLQNYSYMMYENNIETKHITEGEVMIFPSNMLHYCLPIEKERWVIVWNYTRPTAVLNHAYKNAHKYKVTE